MWREDDAALLARLEDELVLEKLHAHHTGGALRRAFDVLPRRAAGLVSSARRAGAADLVAQAVTGDVVPLVRWLEAPPLAQRPPELLHHLALYHAAVARTLEDVAAEAAANAWSRAVAAWLALGQEHAYLAALEEAVLGKPSGARREADLRIAPERVVLELAGELGQRAQSAARDLTARGHAALLALGWTSEAARLAGATPEAARPLEREAERRRTAAIDAALGLVGDALDEANTRGAIAQEGRGILERALGVWYWSGRDEHVEEWVVDRLGTIAWELRRARAWDALRALLAPFLPIIESLAQRIERDATKIAFSSHCAQMFVFLADVENDAARRRALAERAVRVCPTHRNGRVVLASYLCDDALAKLRTMTLVVRRDELALAEAMLERAEKLYPQLEELADAKATLERVKKAKVAL